MDVDTHSDRLVAKFPVYLSKVDGQKALLLQYPLRPVHRPYEADLGQPSHARFKPHAKLLEIHYPYEHQLANFSELRTVGSRKLELKSRELEPNCRYAIGLISSRGLTLTPVDSVLQMIPSLDKSWKEEASGDLHHEQDDEKVSDEDRGDDEITRVNVRLKKSKASRVEATTYGEYRHQVEKESPVELEIRDMRAQRGVVFEADQSLTIHQVSGSLGLDPYIEKLAEESKKNSSILESNVQKILLSAQIVTFRDMCLALNQKTNAEVSEMIRILNRHAHYVLGRWIAKSDFSYNGHNALCRDILIGLFYKRHGVVSRSQIAKVCRLSVSAASRIFSELAVLRKTEDKHFWYLKYGPDESFDRK